MTFKKNNEEGKVVVMGFIETPGGPSGPDISVPNDTAYGANSAETAISPRPQPSNDSDTADGPNTAERSTTQIKDLANVATTDPFDPMNLGISTEYATAINVQKSTKAEGRKPNEQEYFRVSPLTEHRLTVASIADKQDNGKIYIVSSSVLDAIKAEFPRLVRAVLIVLGQTLIGTVLAWPVPLAEDRGGKWNSQQRAASEQGKTIWTNMASNHSHAQYDISTVDNPKEVDWSSSPPFAEILRQAFSERLIDSMDHPLLKKLRGKIE